MKVQEIMERAGVSDTGRAIAYIKDALEDMNILSETHVNTEKIDITKDQRFYDLPFDALQILSIRCKNQNNNTDEYRKIPRMIGEAIIEDSSGELK